MMVRSFRADLETICSQDAQRRAFIDPKSGRVWTYSALLDVVVGFSSVLWNAGVRSGDRVLSLLPNSMEQMVAFLAALWSGVDFCPVSPLSTSEEARRFTQICRGTVALVPDKISANLSRDLSNATKKKLLIPIAVDGDLTRYMVKVPAGLPDSINQSGKLLLFTSGTTSSPKAMVLDGDRLWSSAKAWVGFHSFLGEETRFYNNLPMSYLGGLFNLGLIPLACHGSVVVSDAFSGVTALKFWREAECNGVNTLWLAPTILRSLVSLYKRRRKVGDANTRVRAAFIGMAPIGLAEKHHFEENFDIPLLENFALSETTFLTSEELNSCLKRCPGSVGKVLPWVTLRFSPVEGEASQSEILVKTPFLFDGYLNADGEIALPLTSDGFFRTGDLGEFNEEGSLILKGRCKDVIKKGGYLVSLRDLEEVAEAHPFVSEAAAIGVPHEFYGESPVLCIQLVERASSSREALADLKLLLMNTLAKFKWPDEIIAMESLPKTETGKVQKRVLKTWIDSRRGLKDSVRLQ